MESSYDELDIDSLSREIDTTVDEIWEMLNVDNPALLIARILQIEDSINTIPVEGALVTRPAESIVHTAEFLQALLVIKAVTETPAKLDSGELQSRAHQLLCSLSKLSDLLKSYLFESASKARETNSEFGFSPIEAQFFQRVQGSRYYCFERSYHELLLHAHDAELRKLFGISSAQLLDGFDELRYQLTYQKIDDFERLVSAVDHYQETGEPNHSFESVNSTYDVSDEVGRLLSDKRYEVSASFWPDGLIHALTWQRGDCSCRGGKHPFWPLYARQVQQKPFIQIGAERYCFDYYSFVDNFYRSVSQAILERDPQYEQEWQRLQKEASESAVGGIFKRLLPGCQCYGNNYYGQKGKRVENDLLIVYKDALLIVEVKAGAFTLAPPLEEFESHVARYKDLLEKGCSQCQRLLSHIENNNELILYDKPGRGNVKARIRLSDISHAYAFCVTVENVNEFAAKVEKLAFLETYEGVIALSLDDLLVYEDYFDKPLTFLHYIKHREAATRHKKIALNDELDHLGLYIEHKCYERFADELPEGDYIFGSFRQAIDDYYEWREAPNHSPLKPSQYIPDLMVDILDRLTKSADGSPVFGACALLDLPDREGICARIESIRAEQCRCGRQLAYLCEGSNAFKMFVFVNQPSLAYRYSEQEKKERAAIELFGSEHSSIGLLILTFDAMGFLWNATFSVESIDGYSEEALMELREKRFYFKVRQEGVPARNEPCPCGSGLKYKRCHGRASRKAGSES